MTCLLHAFLRRAAAIGGALVLAATAAGAASICTAPIAAADVTGTGAVTGTGTAAAAVVGDGTAASCTEVALRAAIDASPVVTFACGDAPATIAIAATLVLPARRNTVIDGGNRITLDGGGRARIFDLVNPNYRTNPQGLTLQHIALRNGRAAGSGYVAPDPANAACASGYADGNGAAIQVRDARLHVIDVEFSANAAASPGPDVGGGAIYAGGSLDVLIVGSRFIGNTGANAGAVGALQSNLRIYDSTFTGNLATGTGANYAGGAATGCPGVGHPSQGGAGGNGGAIAIDGSDDTDVIVCGSTFTGNQANELAGALFRTANIGPRRTTLDRSTFVGNRARQGGALFLMNSAPLEIVASTFAGNRAVAFGAAQLQNAQFTIENSTFSGNEATGGPAGALFLAGSAPASVIRNSTFAGNRASAGAGAGPFGAALSGDTGFRVLNTVFADTAEAAGATGNAFPDPRLGALADNGGPTPTHAPAADSALRGAGRDCPATDQRGRPRRADRCTVGAVE